MSIFWALIRSFIMLRIFSSMPLTGFLLTVAAAAMWACGNIVSRAVGRYGPMNQLAFVVWASLVPPLGSWAR